MPVSYHIDKSHKLVVTTAKGALTRYELLNHQNRILSDPDFDATYWQLHDVRAANLVEVRPDCVSELAQHAVPKPGTRSAIVVESQLADQLARIFEGMRVGTGEEIRIFRDLDSARTWLEGVPQGSEDSSTGRPQEQRPAPRKQARFSVFVRSGVQERSAQVVDISLSGALVECPAVLPVPGAPIKIQFGPPEADPPIELEGMIVRRTDTGFAIHFAAITKELLELVRLEGR